MTCGSHRFRCSDKCATLGLDPSGELPLPEPLRECTEADAYDLRKMLPEWVAVSEAEASAATALSATLTSGTGTAGTAGSGLTAADRLTRSALETLGGSSDAGALGSHSARKAESIWQVVDALAAKHDPGDVTVPGPRTNKVDWVMEGRLMPERDILSLQRTMSGLLSDLPPFPDVHAAEADSVLAAEAGTSTAVAEAVAREPVFRGRGVVMVGGGLRYMVPAWVALHVLRKSGCLLPVEIWFPVEEFPPPELEAALAKLGAVARRLDARDLGQKGYGVKVAALLLSSFREVLFLDSDNVVLRDPTYLFDSLPYRQTGAMLWPDFWDSTAAAELPRILNLTKRDVPRGTHESGQMVIDKSRHWRGLLVAAYMNMYGGIFAELLSCYVGKGDKETFAYGMLAAGEPMWVSPVPAGSAGVRSTVCAPPGRGAVCRLQYMGNTMVQHDPDGAPLFFHTNYHKWDLALPASFDAWNRRWQTLQPGLRSVVDYLYTNDSSAVGYDVERFVYDALRGMRCAPWFPAYSVTRKRMGDKPFAPLDGFHPMSDYLTFRDLYRAGWKGNLAQLAYPPLGWRDHLAAWWYGGPRWRLRPYERSFCRLRKKIFPKWPKFLRCKHF
ncbi:hypothetical protein HYH03_000162 [Edaphochlamys debaryana]|uniref:Uncharacterized protein n=1 Tax=Edaphochlamys debaryana TaxID=47281 RepID=A0A836C6Y2_9CHLO|nr:hypothetical protein HYH03_000162 [Edaphochlamys debaryana]|eukprot:KAG2501658.1 hypothetical protein HYH03_000162 [Edaphochlamys debaryana]